MPKSFIFATFDSAAQSYMQPFFAPHAGVAVRGFNDAIRSKSESDLANHPDDFELFELGIFDSDHAEFELYAHPKLLVSGKQIAAEPELPFSRSA